METVSKISQFKLINKISLENRLFKAEVRI